MVAPELCAKRAIMNESTSKGQQADRSWATKAKAATHFGCDIRTIRSLMRCKIIPYAKIPGLHRLASLADCDQICPDSKRLHLDQSSTHGDADPQARNGHSKLGQRFPVERELAWHESAPGRPSCALTEECVPRLRSGGAPKRPSPGSRSARRLHTTRRGTEGIGQARESLRLRFNGGPQHRLIAQDPDRLSGPRQTSVQQLSR
jgi:hypothetical protein